MSCHSTPCHTSNLSGCGVELCSTTKLSTNSVIYTGPTLACSGISSCDTLTDALQKLDFRLCNLPSFTLTANNGITKTLNNFQLGGPLVQQTVIGTTAANSLVITGLVTVPSPQFLVSQDNSGIITKTSFSTISSTILGSLIFNNGLTKTGNTIQLGGTLIKPTTITTSATNTISLAGLVADPTPAYVLTESTSGTVVKTLASSIIPVPTPPTTADNGLNMSTVSNVQLGGALTTLTNIITDATNTLSITGLSTDATPDFYLTETNAGVVKKIGSATVASNVLSTLTANNGLTKTGTNIQLGGTLIQSTSVDLDSYALTVRDLPSGAGFKIDPAGFAPNTHIKTQVYKPVQFIDAIGINVGPYNNNEKFLNVGKVGVFTNTATETTTDVYISMTATGSETSTTVYAADMNRFIWSMNGNQTIRRGTVLAANFAYLQVTSNFATSSPANDVGSLSASVAQCYFTGSGATERAVAFRAFPPIKDAVLGFTGTVTEVIGVQIDDQRTFDVEANITTTYGVRQLGVEDINHFRGTFQLPSSNTSIGTATLVAGTVTVSTVSAKTGSKIFLSVNTPGGTQGFLSAPAASIIDGASFVINSTSATDTSTVNWWIINS